MPLDECPTSNSFQKFELRKSIITAKLLDGHETNVLILESRLPGSTNLKPVPDTHGSSLGHISDPSPP